jgi:hypothetical protein
MMGFVGAGFVRRFSSCRTSRSNEWNPCRTNNNNRAYL